jgi:hypothetical protein
MKRILAFCIAGLGAMITTCLHCRYWSDRIADYTGDKIALTVVPAVFALAATVMCFFVLSPRPSVRGSWFGVSVVFAFSYVPILALWFTAV